MKNKTLARIFVVSVVIGALCSTPVLCLEKPTHQAVNQNIASRTIGGFSLNEYLINVLGFEKGINEPLWGYHEETQTTKERPIVQWLGYGGIKEDEPEGLIRYVTNFARNNNHFHDPVRSSWDTAGFVLNAPVPGLPIDIPLPVRGESSLCWAQNRQQILGGQWSWHDARRFYLEGLTASYKGGRSVAFANTFRALGQLMHLVQDASVPAHTRNEWHNLWFHYEPWLEKVRTEEVETFGGFISNPISFHPSVLERPRNDLAPVPIAGIFDTDQYTGDNPDVTAGNIVGLAEYTNANFFGEATVFAPKFPYATRDYPYPSEKTSVEKKNRKIPDPRNTSKTVMRQYYVKKADGERGDPEKGYRVATVGFLKDYIIKYFPLINLLAKPALDGGVYHDYAELLLPRAVGYSAGLLKYFFRGRLDMKRIGLGNNGETILAITNLSEEPMVRGSFELYYDNDRDVRTPLRLSDKQVENLPPYDGTSRTVFVTRFVPPTDFHPDKKSQYILVYRGQLGREEEAVIGYHKTFFDYGGSMVVYHKHLRRLFFMAKDPRGEEINGFIDLRDIIKPNETTSDWEDYSWWNWYRSDYNPLAVRVLEYNALKGVLILRNEDWYDDVEGPSYGDFFSALRFEITGMSNPSEYFDFNLGGEIGDEPWQGVSGPTDYSYYGERISYGNGPYGLGLKRFYRYDFRHELKKIGPSWVAYTAGRGNLSVWEDGNLENPSLNDLKWSFNFVLGDTSENPYRGWVQYHDVYSVSWNTSPTMVLSRFLMGYDTLHHPSGFDYREPYCSRVTGMATPMKDDLTGPSEVWTEWEKDGFCWHYEPLGIDQPMEYAYMAVPVSYVGLPGGGLQKRTMGAFHEPDSLDVIGDHYRMDNNYYFDGENEIPSYLMDPDTYPFGKSEKELHVAYLAIEPNGVPVMSVSSYNTWIGAANPGKSIDFYPRSWHYFKLTGKLRKLDGTVETIDGIDASRRNGFWHQYWAQGTFYAPDGVWADHRYLSDYGLMAK